MAAIIESKRHNGLKLEDKFYGGRIRNSALYFFRKIIYNVNVKVACNEVVKLFDESEKMEEEYEEDIIVIIISGDFLCGRGNNG